ncbi:uncharacterized protein [Venturia canescens]|nr:uncharacterized protein LOC122415553 isoform X2 [Venturia canescens]
MAQMIVEPYQFRLSAHGPNDDYIIEHFLYGVCSRDRYNVTSRNNDPHRVAVLNNSETMTRLASDSENNSSSHGTNETMYTALPREESIPITENYVDESQAVVLASDLKICQPTLAGGDAAKETLSHEKRPCNVEYELEVKPKMMALERETRKLALKSNVENQQQKRSVRTRSRRTKSTRTEDSNLNDAENVDPEFIRIKEEPIVDFPGSFNSPDTEMPVKLERSPGDAIPITASPQLSASSDSDWIEMKIPSSEENVRTKFADAAIPAERRKAKAEISNPLDQSKVVNICYRGFKGAAKPSENSRKSSPSQPSKRKHVHEISSDSETTGNKRTRNNYKGRELDNERNSRRRERQVRSPDEEDDDEKEEETEQRYRTKHGQNANGATGTKPKQRLLNLQEKSSFTSFKKKMSESLESEEYIESSSDTSLSDSLNDTRLRRKYSRRQDHELTRKTTSKKSLTRRWFEEEQDEAGPSGIQNPENDRRQELYDDSSDDDDMWDALPESHYNSNLYMEHVDTKKQINHEKTRSRKELTGSRVQKWRSGLGGNDMGERGARGGPFNRKEQEIMIKYLLRNRKVCKGKGLLVWSQLIDDGFLPHRTPQSLHNHFTKIILPNIENFTKLTVAERQLFLKLREEKRERR